MGVFTLSEASRAFFRAAALQAAHRLRLFAALEAPTSGEALAAALGVGWPRLQALLDVLVLEGALVRDGPCYARAAQLPEVPPAVPAQGPGLLAEVLLRDEPLPEAGVLGHAAGELARFHAHLTAAGAAAAAEVAEALAPLLPPAATVLDLGSGAGLYSRALLELLPAAQAILIDRPDVLALAGDHPRRQRVAVDLTSGAYPAGQVALLANVLHLFGESDCQAMVARARAAAPVVAVVDLFAEEESAGPPAALYFSLSMALYTRRGRVHPPSALQRWLPGGRWRRLARDPSMLLFLDCGDGCL